MGEPRPRVILAHCDEYDAGRIQEIVTKGMAEMDLRPTGRTLVKPNLVAALRTVFDHAFTRPEFLDGVLGAIKARADDDLEEIAVGERGGITIPSRMSFSQSGHNRVIRKHGVERYMFDEVAQVPMRLEHPDALRDLIYVPEPLTRTDFFVNLPKFKTHPWTTVTFGAKNYIGLQDDRHRLIDHDNRLNEKIADLQEIIQPQLICLDAILAGEGRMLTPKPFPLHLVIMGNNQMATDSVCCHILGIDPMSVDHIRLCHERGYGPLDLEQIEITGDVTLATAQERAKGTKVGLIRVEDFFADTPITALAGPPPTDPDQQHCDYCWGGCPGALEEAIDILLQFKPNVYDTMKPLTIVFGAYDGPIEPKEGEKVVFVGDCCTWKGTVHGRPVEIENVYTDRAHKDPHRARMTDIFLKMARFYWSAMRARGAPFLRIPGCPVSVAENVLAISAYGRTINPYFAPKTVVPFMMGWLGYRLSLILRAMFGRSYHKALPEPVQSLGLPEPARPPGLPEPGREEPPD